LLSRSCDHRALHSFPTRRSSDLAVIDNRVGYIGSQNLAAAGFVPGHPNRELVARVRGPAVAHLEAVFASDWYMETGQRLDVLAEDRKSTRLNSSHVKISYAVFCL